MNNVYLNWFTNDEQFPFFIQYGGHDEDMDLHKHDNFTELVIVLSGNATHIVNSEAYFIKKGNVFVINGATPHAFKNPHEFKICNIMFRPEILRSAGPDLRTSNGFQALFILEPFYRNIHSFQSRLNLSIPSMEHVSSIISVMINEYNNKLQGYQTMLISRFMELVVHLSRQYDSQENGTDNNLMHLANAISYIEDHYLGPLTLEEVAARSKISVRHKLIAYYVEHAGGNEIGIQQAAASEPLQEVVDYIHTHYRDNLTIRELAERVHLHPSYFIRVFKRHFGASPIQFINKKRIEEAKRLLTTTNIPLSEIGDSVGIPDICYLSKLFKSMTGFSPSIYRQTHYLISDKVRLQRHSTSRSD